MDAGRGDQRERAQALRRAHRHFEPDPAAERLADDVHPGELQRRDGVEVEIGEVGNVIDEIRHFGRAKTRMVGRDDVEALGEAIEQSGPFGEPVGAVQIKQRLALAAPAQREPGAVDVDRRGGECHGFLPPRRLWARRGACKYPLVIPAAYPST